MAFNPGPGSPGPAGSRPGKSFRIRPRRIIRPMLPQANQGRQYGQYADQAGPRPRWLPRIRSGHAFLPPWGQQAQSVEGPPAGQQFQAAGPFPLRFTARIMRGRIFAPPWGQASRGVQFPLFVRERRGYTPKYYPRIRQGHAFAPVQRQTFGDQGAAHFTVQGGSRPRYAPPHRVTAGRVFMPGLGQGQLGSRPPQLFFRQTLHPARFRAGHTAKVSHPTLVWTAVIPLTASGSMTIRSFANRQAAIAMTASGHMTIAATRTQFAGIHLTAAGAMTVAGTANRAARIAMLASGHMAIAASMTKPAAIAFTASGSMHIAAVTTRQAAIRLTASGSMTVAATSWRAAFIHMTAAGSMAVAPVVTETAALAWTASGAMAVSPTATRFAGIAMTAAGAMAVAGQAVKQGSIAMTASGSMSVAATTAVGLPFRAAGSMTIAAQLSMQTSIAMAAAGSMAVDAVAGPPGRIIVIESGAVTLLPEGTSPETGPFIGPSVVQVTDVED